MKHFFKSLCLVLFALSYSIAWAEDAPTVRELPQWKFEKQGSSLPVKESSDHLLGLPAPFYETMDADTRRRAWLGVSIKPTTSRSSLDPAMPALEVQQVFPDSVAKKAGLMAGDLITRFNEMKLSKGETSSLAHHFRRQVAAVGPGAVVRLQVERDGNRFPVEIRLGEKPSVPYTLMEKVRRATPVKKEASLLHHLLTSSGQMPEFEKNIKGFGDRADEVVSTAVKGKAFNPFRLDVVTSLLHRPLALPTAGDAMIGSLDAAWNENGLNLPHLFERGAAPLDYVLSMPGAMSQPQTLTQYLDRLIEKLVDVQGRYRALIDNLSPNEITRLESWFRKWMDTLDQDETKLTAKQKKKSEALTLDLLHIAMKVDVQGLLSLAHELATALDIPRLKKLAAARPLTINYPEGWTADPEADRTLFDTPAGLVVVGKEGTNMYHDEAVVILDLGGDDIYRNRAGGARPGLPFTIVIDLAGDDRYLSDEPFSQGSGFLGAGFLIDLAGDDWYHAEALSQGNGVFGTGLLLDVDGRDHYRCKAFCQAAGSWGIGLLIDENGYDDYTTDLYAQGFGFVKGFGALLDRAGDDHYFAGGRVRDHRQPEKATLSMAQGVGFGLRPWETVAGTSGGIGVLSDASGNDVYAADYFAQGSSYWLALGILHDGSGHDQYIAGRYSQGAGVHYSLGLLIDETGEDQYSAHFGVSQGCGHDFAAGFLMDRQGDDRYISGVLAQGVGNANGLGVLADTGGRDEYFVKSEGQGRGHYEPMREMGSFGFLIDTGGDEDHYTPKAANNRSVVKHQYGFTADTN